MWTISLNHMSHDRSIHAVAQLILPTTLHEARLICTVFQRYRSSSRGRDRSETPPHWRREQQRPRPRESRPVDQSSWARGDGEGNVVDAKDKGHRRELSERFQKAERSEKADRNEKTEQSEKPEGSEKDKGSEKEDVR